MGEWGEVGIGGTASGGAVKRKKAVGHFKILSLLRQTVVRRFEILPLPRPPPPFFLWETHFLTVFEIRLMTPEVISRPIHILRVYARDGKEDSGNFCVLRKTGQEVEKVVLVTCPISERKSQSSVHPGQYFRNIRIKKVYYVRSHRARGQTIFASLYKKKRLPDNPFPSLIAIREYCSAGEGEEGG